MRIVPFLAAALACGETSQAPATDTDSPAPEAEPATDTGGGERIEALDDPPTDLSEACWSFQVTDRSDDGTADATILEFYRPEDLLRTWYAEDEGPDGEVDVAYEFRYDPVGNLVYQHLDYTDPFAFQRAWEWVYVDGLLVRYAEDTEGDGTWDDVTIYGYVDGLAMTAERDEGDDGAVDVWLTYTRDAWGRALSIAYDRGNDGIVDQLSVFTYVDEADRAEVARAWDEDNDGVVDETYLWVYDAEERLVRYESGDVDGAWAYDYRYADATADSSGSSAGPADVVAFTSAFTSADGASDVGFSHVFTFEAPGRRALELTEVDVGRDATIDQIDRETTTWFCP